MDTLAHNDPAQVLEKLHNKLDLHFGELAADRQSLDTPAAVFALEHGLTVDERTELARAIGEAHRLRLVPSVSPRWWLPFVVHAAEVGYSYDGVEYWPVYLDATPNWVDSDHERDRVRSWFVKFADVFGGAVPQGAWARTFKKIAWPITHAVLPKYLQVQLAKMLADHRTGWPNLLDDPAALGVRLHSWSRLYSDRLEKFCQNTELVGRVAVALLLSGDSTISPYIHSATLARIVESLNSERQSRRWLSDARKSASSVRARNFRQASGDHKVATNPSARPATTDPRLHLRQVEGTWQAFALLPDLKPLQHTVPLVYEELRNRRASIAGSGQIPTGGLLYPLPAQRLKTWPSPLEPFLQLRGASAEVNLLLADQCRISSGPWWVFRTKADSPAIEVKGKFVRPGAKYCIIGDSALKAPDVEWCSTADLEVTGMSAHELSVPATLTELETEALLSAGLSIASDVRIRPVGVVASNWDSEGTVEWLAGEPALIAIQAEHSPLTARLTIDGEDHFVKWPDGQSELFLSLGTLGVGLHEVAVSLGDFDTDARRTDGVLLITIRDPEVRAESGTSGEGIRLRTSPAQPTLSELWGGRATLEVDGPMDATAEFCVALRDHDGVQVAVHRQPIQLPVSILDWTKMLVRLREQPSLAKHYDNADSIQLAVSRAGVGFAELACERGFEPLRWVMRARHRDGGYAARLIDRSDGDPVDVLFYPAERPTDGQQYSITSDEFVGPPRGGLLWASNGEQLATQIVPPDPNQLLQLRPANPSVPTGEKSLPESTRLIRSHNQWLDAQLPADPFGARERRRVLDAITGSLVGLLAGRSWAAYEQQSSGLAYLDFDLDRAQKLVSENPAHQGIAREIGSSLYEWSSAELLMRGFRRATKDLMSSAGMSDPFRGSRFLLQLASSPGELLDWDAKERNRYLRCVFTDPALLRAARFAVLGTAEELDGTLS